MKVLHVLPDTAADPRQRYLGSTKDARGRTEYFREKGLAAVELVVPGRKDAALLRSLEALDLTGFQAVFLELPIYPRSQSLEIVECVLQCVDFQLAAVAGTGIDLADRE